MRALPMWISLRHSVSLFLTLPMDQTNYLDLKCSNLKCHHDSETAAEKFCSFENSPAYPAFKKQGKDLNRRIAKRQNLFSFQHQFGLCLRAAKCERIVKVGESDGAFLVMRPLTLPHTNSRHLRTNYNTLLIFIIGEYPMLGRLFLTKLAFLWGKL